MLAQNSYEYIQIGLALRLLRKISDSHAASFASQVESDLKTQLTKANFSVSLAATTSVDYREMLRSIAGLGPDATLTPSLAAEIARQSAILEGVVFAEALTKKLYVLPGRRFNTEYLLNDPAKLLKEGAFEKLQEIARTDFASACRCILFGEATAAAFHILRATECVLKAYYRHHRRQNRLARPMWGPMVEQLKAKTRNKPPATLLTSLDLIREAYRNPTQHPEAIYQIDSAQDLFGVCLDAIGKMVDEL